MQNQVFPFRNIPFNYSDARNFWGASPPWTPHQGLALDPLGTLSGPQTPCRNFCLHIILTSATPLAWG